MEEHVTFTVHAADGYGDEASAEIRRAIQLIALADERRLKRIQKHVSVILAAPLPFFGRYIPKLRLCVVDYKRTKDGLGEGEALDDMLARLIVSCSVNAVLETKGIDLDPYPVSRIHELCDAEALRFSRAVERYNERKATMEMELIQSQTEWSADVLSS